MTHQPRTLTSHEEMRLFLGFLAQPFVAFVVAFVAVPFVVADGKDDEGAALAVAAGAFILAVGFTLVCAAPIAIGVLKRRAVSLPVAILFGLALGNIPFAIGAVLSGFANLSRALGGAALGSLIGAAGAAAFWAISIRGRDFSRDPD